jgi:hypothetical protein
MGSRALTAKPPGEFSPGPELHSLRCTKELWRARRLVALIASMGLEGTMRPMRSSGFHGRRVNLISSCFTTSSVCCQPGCWAFMCWTVLDHRVLDYPGARHRPQHSRGRDQNYSGVMSPKMSPLVPKHKTDVRWMLRPLMKKPSFSHTTTRDYRDLQAQLDARGPLLGSQLCSAHQCCAPGMPARVTFHSVDEQLRNRGAW